MSRLPRQHQHLRLEQRFKTPAFRRTAFDQPDGVAVARPETTCRPPSASLLGPRRTGVAGPCTCIFFSALMTLPHHSLSPACFRLPPHLVGCRPVILVGDGCWSLHVSRVARKNAGSRLVGRELWRNLEPTLKCTRVHHLSSRHHRNCLLGISHAALSCTCVSCTHTAAGTDSFSLHLHSTALLETSLRVTRTHTRICPTTYTRTNSLGITITARHRYPRSSTNHRASSEGKDAAARC